MAEIKTIYKGESVTLLFTFPEAYDMARLASHKIFVGETEFTGVIDGQTIKMQLKSSDTDHMIGTHKVVLWIDDAVLGLRKPYCGDLVIAKTQASGSTTSVSNISDIIIPVVISETAITVGDVLYNYMKGDKGDKGDPFTYSDFTPEQIDELQQPAAEAIASIEAVELAIEQAEVLRVQAEQSRQTNTATAIQNAETATTNANNAASLANEKAGLANNAATLANEKAGLAATAATQANTAMDGANSAAQSATNLVNSYATDLEAKANKVQEAWITPTLLNGWVSSAGNEIQFYKDNFGIVRMRGAASGGTFTTTVFTFPAGYRPARNFGANTSSGIGTNGYMNILQSGVVWFRVGASNNVDNITFKAEQ